MSKSVYVYSTLSAPQRYTKYAKGNGDMSREESSVLIKGGANVADKNFITARGVVTQITPEEHEQLKENTLFQTHVANGYIIVDAANVDIDKIVSDMEGRDESAPLTPDDFVAEGATPPVVAGITEAPAKPKGKGGRPSKRAR